MNHKNVTVCRIIQCGKEGEAMSEANSEPVAEIGYCVVGGAHAFILKISRIIGLAPLRFKSRNNGFSIEISNAMCIYSYIMVIFFAICAIHGMVVEINIGPELSIRMSSRKSQFVSTINIMVVVVIAGAAVFGAPKRMRNMLKFMESIASVDASIGAYYSRATERKLCTTLIMILLLFSIFLISDICFFVIQAKESDRQWDVVKNDFGFYVLYYVVVMMELQFAFIAYSVQGRVKAVNGALELTARQISIPDYFIMEQVRELPPLNFFALRVAAESRRCTTFSLLESPMTTEDYAVIKRNTEATETPEGINKIGVLVNGGTKLIVPPHEAVRRLAYLHGALCKVVYSVNKSYGLPVILMLVSMLLHLIVTAYFLIVEIIILENRIYFLVLQFFWCVTHILRVIMIVEPCHYTIAESKATESLVCRLMTSTTSSGMLPSRLELFSRQLMIQTMSYTPMGVCTLNRSLVASVLGMVTTYLVILLQFQSYDE